MTQAPTPGPLSAVRVDLGLVATTIETMHRRIEDLTGSRQSQYDGAVALARDLYLSAPTPPVEASGSERERLARIISPSAFLPETASHNTVFQSDRLPEARMKALAKADKIISSRPQPSRETREDNGAIGRLAALLSVSHLKGDHPIPGLGAVSWDDLRAILALIRLAPVASGGQHSSGEGGMVRWGLVWQGETTWFDTKEEALSAKGSSQGVELVSSVPEWRSGEGAPTYPKGAVVSYRGRQFRALRAVKASAKTNAPNYSGFWEEVK